jgi:uncharacterized protein YjbI with pentapeptide repeats
MILTFIGLCCAAQQKSNPTSSNDLSELIMSGKPVYMQNQVFNENIDFTSLQRDYNVKSGVSQVNISSPVTFVNCTFKGDVTGNMTGKDGAFTACKFVNNLVFINCNFENKVNFNNCEFQGLLDFTGSSFLKEVTMNNTFMANEVYFRQSVFQEDAQISNAYFNRKITMAEATFYKNVTFQGSTFLGEIQAFSTKFIGYTDFSQTDLRGRSFFTYADFRSRAEFSNSVFHGSMDFVSASFGEVRFDNSRFLDVYNFNYAKKVKSVTFNNAIFQIDVKNGSYRDLE